MNSLSMPYFQHGHCLAMSTHRQQTVREREYMMEIFNYLSDSDATSEPKLPVIDSADLQSYTNRAAGATKL